MFAAIALICLGGLTSTSPTEASLPQPKEEEVSTPFVVTADMLPDDFLPTRSWDLVCAYAENGETQRASCKFTGNGAEANKILQAMEDAVKEQRPNATIISLYKKERP